MELNRQFSLLYLTAAKCPPPEMIYIAGRAGYQYVSLRTIAMGLPGELNFGLARNPELLSHTTQALAETGVKLLDIECARIDDKTDLQRYMSEMEVAAGLGAKAVTANVWTNDKHYNAEMFARLCAQAKRFGLQVNLEFVTWSAVKDICDAVELIDAAGADNAAIAVDTLHFHRSSCQLEELENLPPRLLGALHLCDAPGEIPTTVEGLIHAGRSERLYLGEGGVDTASIARRMPSGMIYAVEIPHLERVNVIGSAEHAHRALETAKSYLKANGL